MQAIIFDLDGTLIDSRTDIVTSIQVALARLGVDDTLGPEAIGALVGRPLREMIQTTASTLDKAELERAVTLYRDHFSRHFQDKSQVFPGVSRGLALLSREFPLGCATTKPPASTEQVLTAFGLRAVFTAVRGTEGNMAYKPAPDVLLAIAQDLEIDPASLLYVGDTVADIQAAHAAGAKAAWAKWGYGKNDACLSAQPEFVLEDPLDLPSLNTR